MNRGIPDQGTSHDVTRLSGIAESAYTLDRMGGHGLKRPAVIIGALIVGIAALIFYFGRLPPEGIEPMGDELTVAWISLAVAVVSLLAAVIGLIQRMIELRQASR